MLGDAFNGLFNMFIVGLIAVVIVVCFGLYKAYRLLVPQEIIIESKYIIKPQIKLHTDGIKIDTTYIYKKTK